MRAWIKEKIQLYLKSHGLRITYDRDDRVLSDFDLLTLLLEANDLKSNQIRSIVQIGANDGLVVDPVVNLINKSDARAFLLEPLPDRYEKLASLYADNRRVTTIRAALNDTNGEAILWRVAPDNESLANLSVYSSFDRSKLERQYSAYAGLGGRIIGETVQSLTAEAFIEKYNLETIDLLQVDTEGWDARVVNWFLDCEIPIRAINYEHVHLYGAEDSGLISRLKGKGYRLARYGLDTTAILD
ncbi:FkbM family methyltransferase [Mucisphaera sp.]|uniref:FkbM family methyltransferase n=1 Tax=Mucisphaera sp. TaxID=2913024 RepID=UPI003D0CB711